MISINKLLKDIINMFKSLFKGYYLFIVNSFQYVDKVIETFMHL